MPAQLTYPGVYIEEVPSGVRTITGVATSITAFVGRAARGPVNDPTDLFNFGDFERTFGGLRAEYPLSYAVRDFFLNGGNQAVIVRLYRGDAGAATLEPSGLKLVAANPGEWGKRLRATITRPTGPAAAELATRYGLAADAFSNLQVREDRPNGLREEIRNLTVVEGPRRVDRVLEQESLLVRVPLRADGTPDLPAAAPAATTEEAAAEDGSDGDPLDQLTYVGDKPNKTGFHALEKADIFNMLCIPPDRRDAEDQALQIAVYQAALRYCVERRAMLIVDPPLAWGKIKETAAATARDSLPNLTLSGTDTRNAALYFPRVIEVDPLREGQPDVFAPCGIIAGIYARTDRERGVWKAPAGLDAGINGIVGLQATLTDDENGQINPLGINCLRFFPVGGRVVWGARTLRGADQLADEYKYVPVRRLALYIEESLYRGTQWVVFEPNDEPLWAQIRLNVGAFMQGLFRQGAFQGSTPREAYLVKCDKETTTQYDIDRGIVNIVVGFAPLKPAEFVVIKIQQLARQER
jgi:phage tail sheath protein FI